MQPIPGLENELGAIVAEIQKDRLAEQRSALRGQVNGIYTNILSWQAAKAKVDAESKKLAEKIAKAQSKLEAIKAGDWSVLQEDQKDADTARGDGKKSPGPASSSPSSSSDD